MSKKKRPAPLKPHIEAGGVTVMRVPQDAASMERSKAITYARNVARKISG